MTRRSFIACLTAAAACIGLSAATDSPAVKATIGLTAIEALFQAESGRMSMYIAQHLLKPSPWLSLLS